MPREKSFQSKSAPGNEESKSWVMLIQITLDWSISPPSHFHPFSFIQPWKILTSFLFVVTQMAYFTLFTYLCMIKSDASCKKKMEQFGNKALQNVEENKTPDIVKLKHPRTGIGAMFLFSSDNSIVQEIFCFSDKRSWFINDTVKEDGKLFLSTPVDPLFLVLPILRKSDSEGKVLPLEDLLFNHSHPEMQRLSKSAKKSLHLIADRKGPEELNAWVYAEDKTMKWLIKKTEKVARVLKEKRINLSGSATSKNFIKSTNEDALNGDGDVHLRDALKFVSEYLANDLSLKLCSRLGLEMDEKPNNKRKSSRNEENETTKRVKVKEDVGKQEKGKAAQAREKAMQRAASGSKSITSFFKKT